MSATNLSSSEPGGTSGSVEAGGKIQADNIVTGSQVHGADAETAQRLLGLSQQIKSGHVKAVQDIIAKNIVTGFQYLGQSGDLTPEQFRHELAELRQQLTAAIEAGEIEDRYEAEDAQKAVDRAMEQVQADQPVAEQVVRQLDTAATLIERAAQVAQATGNFGARIIKLAPIAAALYQLAQRLF